MRPSSRTFSRPRTVIAWPHVEDVPGAYGEISSVAIGPRGDEVATLQYSEFFDTKNAIGRDSKRGAEAHSYREVILPVDGKPWRRQVRRTEDWTGAPAAIGSDGSVLRDTYHGTTSRWRTGTCEFRTRRAYLKAVDVRGDALIGDQYLGGSLGLWPGGGDPQRPADAPPGEFSAAALTNDGTAFVLNERGGESRGLLPLQPPIWLIDRDEGVHVSRGTR